MSTYCDRCQLEIPSKSAEIMASMGMLMSVKFRATRGYFCRQCLTSIFWKAATTNLTVGLFWTFGLLAGPLLTFANVFPMFGTRKLPASRYGFQPPDASDEVIQKVFDLIPRLADDIERETGDLHESAVRFAQDTGLRPAQIIHAIRLIAAAEVPPSGERGFEVILNHGGAAR